MDIHSLIFHFIKGTFYDRGDETNGFIIIFAWKQLFDYKT